jgi:hypothetical protein
MGDPFWPLSPTVTGWLFLLSVGWLLGTLAWVLR